MLRRIVLPVLAVALIGGAAPAAEGLFKPEVEVDMELGGTAVGVAGGNWTAFSFSPSLQVRNAGPGLNIGLRLRGLFTSEADFTEDDLDATGHCAGFMMNGYAGWGFALGDNWSLSLLGGFGYRLYGAGYDTEEFLGDKIDYDVSVSAATFDLGVSLRGRLGDSAVWTTTIMGGPVISGDIDADVQWYSLYYDSTEDIEAGAFFELRSALDFRISERLSFSTGLVFEVFVADVDVDEDDDFESFGCSTFAATFGLSWKF